MSIVDFFRSRFDKEREKLLYLHLPADCVASGTDYQPLVAKKHYVRLWLSEMFLKKQIEWGKTLFPAVHSLVRFEYGSVVFDIPTVADSSKVGLKDDGKGDVVARNFKLTPLLPFQGGTIDLSAGLAAIGGQNHVGNFIKVLSEFSSLLAVPQFSAALGIARPLADGMQALFGGEGSHLSLHDAFVAGKTGGYLVVVRATQAELRDTQFWVVKDELRAGPSLQKNDAFEAFDHMLIRLEVTDQRDDWEELTSIRDPMGKAVEALKGERSEEAQSFLRSAIVAVHEARELTDADRVRAKLKLRADFDQLKKDLGYSNLYEDEKGFSLARSMQLALSVDAALERAEPDFEELFETS